MPPLEAVYQIYEPPAGEPPEALSVTEPVPHVVPGIPVGAAGTIVTVTDVVAVKPKLSVAVAVIV